MAGGLRCSLCLEMVPRAFFSRGQLRKDAKRQCLKCATLLSRLRELSEVQLGCRGEATSDAIVPSCQIIQFVLAALQAHPGHRDVQMDGLVALAHHCCDQAGGRETAWEQGALSVVLAAVDACPGDATVAARVLMGIGNLCDSQRRANTAFEAGALTQVLAAMRAHADDEDVQRFGASALANLCGDSPHAQRIALEDGAVELLVAALEGWQACVDVVSNALHALAALSGSSEIAHAEADLFAAVVAAMDAHRDAVHVQRNGLEAIGNLCDGFGEMQRKALSVGAEQAAFRALNRWGTSDEKVAEAAICGTLEALTQGSGNVDYELGSLCDCAAVAEVLDAAPAAVDKSAEYFSGNEALARYVKRLRERADDLLVEPLKKLRV